MKVDILQLMVLLQLKSNNTFVQCTSNHLAWFAVIVDVSGVSLSFLHG